MPLEFDSLSHGKISLWFFNIEADMILLEHYFLIARIFADIFLSPLSPLQLKSMNFHGIFNGTT